MRCATFPSLNSSTGTTFDFHNQHKTSNSKDDTFTTKGHEIFVSYMHKSEPIISKRFCNNVPDTWGLEGGATKEEDTPVLAL